MSEDAVVNEEHRQDEDAWRQLAVDAAEWPADHEGLQALRRGHVNRLLGEKGLGHLVEKDSQAEPAVSPETPAKSKDSTGKLHDGLGKDVLHTSLEDYKYNNASYRPQQEYEKEYVERLLGAQDEFKELIQERGRFGGLSDKNFAETLLEYGALDILKPAVQERFGLSPKDTTEVILRSRWFAVWKNEGQENIWVPDNLLDTLAPIGSSLRESGLMSNVAKRLDRNDLFDSYGHWRFPLPMDQQIADGLLATNLADDCMRQMSIRKHNDSAYETLREPISLSRQQLEGLLDISDDINHSGVIEFLKKYSSHLDTHDEDNPIPDQLVSVDPEFTIDGKLIDGLIKKGVFADTLEGLKSFIKLDKAEFGLKLVEAAGHYLGDVKKIIRKYEIKRIPGSILRDYILKAPGNGEFVRGNLHLFEDIDEATIEKLRTWKGMEYVREYPRRASEKIRDRWFGEMSYAYLQGGFNKASIGHVIRLRVEHGLEDNIHDASQWLAEFGIPKKTYDIQSIMRQRDTEDFDPEGVTPIKLRDISLERDFFGQLAALSPQDRSRLNFSGKNGVAEQMFYSPEHQLLYRAALEPVDGVPYYKSESFTLDGLFQRAYAQATDFRLDTAFGKGKEETTHSLDADELQKRLEQARAELGKSDVTSILATIDGSSLGNRLGDSALQKLREIAENTAPTARQVSQTVGDLKALGQARRVYIQDTQRWLERHAHTPHERLTKVWSDRGLALAYGVSDGSLAIEAWQKQNALKLEVDRLDQSGELQGEYGFTKDEVLAKENIPSIAEFSRHLSAANTLEALSKVKRWRESRDWDEKLLPSAQLDIKLGDAESAKAYSFEVLDKDDPRGFTIGEDTGCCMTIHGESNSCIKAGYKRRDAGFVAMYAPDGRLAAQSFWYVNPSTPDTLVLDNIEANEGRDLSKVLEVYRQALTSYLTDNSALGIKTVHVGTGYSDVDLGGLKKASTVPPVTSYSDAHTQRLLLELSA